MFLLPVKFSESGEQLCAFGVVEGAAGDLLEEIGEQFLVAEASGFGRTHSAGGDLDERRLGQLKQIGIAFAETIHGVEHGMLVEQGNADEVVATDAVGNIAIQLFEGALQAVEFSRRREGQQADVRLAAGVDFDAGDGFRLPHFAEGEL